MKVSFEVRPENAIQSCDFARIEIDAGRNVSKESVHAIAERLVIPARNAILRMCGYQVMYSYIQPGSVGCEIGVHFGDNSERILKQCNPSKLYLVDPYVNATAGDPWTGPENEIAEIEARMEYMKSRLCGDTRVEFYRVPSDNFFPKDEKNWLDWVYIDGNHNYENVVRDLDNSLRAVKDGGHIFGDDLHDTRWGRDVKMALDEFLERNPKLEVLNRDFDPFIIRVVKQ